MRLMLILIYLVHFYSPLSLAHENPRPDGHAPIGVMADHGHNAGEMMFSLRTMSMKMQGLRSGVQEVSTDETLNSTTFMMAPREMDMWMYMLGAMYGLTDKITLSAMLPYLSNEMQVARRMQNDNIETESSGLGDISITTMYRLINSSNQRALINLGLFLPTGSIKEDRNGVRMGYPMQLGSGSYALQPSFVFSHFWSCLSFGSQMGFKYFLDQNSQGYKRGNQYFANIWGALKVGENLSSSLRLSYEATDPMENSDPNINAMMSPTNPAGFQHGNRAVAYWGINLLGTDWAHGHRLALEFGLPFYQDLAGIQMNTEYIGTLGWQKAF